VRGAAKLVDRLESNLEIGAGETTADRNFSLESVNCLGACALGPVVVVDGEYFGQMAPEKIDDLLQKYQKKSRKRVKVSAKSAKTRKSQKISAVKGTRKVKKGTKKRGR
jgi:(2Fe-2S) ferredoxin